MLGLVGLVYVAMNYAVSVLSNWQQTNYPSGVYDQPTLTWLTTAWQWWLLFIVMGGAVWLLMEAQRRGRTEP
jgi:hypothetical protein